MVARIFIFTGLFLLPLLSHSQHAEYFIIDLSDKSRNVIREMGLSSEFEIIRSEKGLHEFMSILYDRGYLTASYEKKYSNDSTTHTELETGMQFYWVRLNRGNLHKEFIRQAGVQLDQFEENEVNYSRISGVFNKILDYSENSGYPFAAIQLEALSIDMERKAISANLIYTPGPYITFDSIIVDNSRTKTSFLAAYLGLRKGEPYNQKSIDQLDKKIARLGYLENSNPVETIFQDSTYTLKLSLEDRPSNNFNGLVGLFPNENGDGKVLVTGMVYLGLKNLFNSGKGFEFDWNKPNLQTQELSIDYTHPNLFKSPIGMSVFFDLFKQDSSFLNREGTINFDFQGKGLGILGLQASFLASDLLTVDESESYDDLADYNISYYGLNYKLSNLDDWILPRSGWDVSGHIDIGSKNIGSGQISTDSINSSDGGLQLKGLFSAGRYFPIKKRSTILTRLSAGHISNSNLLWNELYRPGGLNSLRGFNEKFFYASSYAYVNIEYRLFFDNESQLIFFYDQGFFRNDLQQEVILDYPSGMGAGFNLKTSFGVLTLLYALGSSNEQPFGMNYSKIHMGYTSRF